MAVPQIEEMVEAGVHFGHRVSRWNPKMKPYIYGKRNLIHIIDLVDTVRGLSRAQRFLTNLVAAGHKIILVGTKRQAKAVIESEATRAGMPYVSERWLGGTLTNYTTIRSRLRRLEELESLESTGRARRVWPRRAVLLHARARASIRRNLEGIRTHRPPARLPRRRRRPQGVHRGQGGPQPPRHPDRRDPRHRQRPDRRRPRDPRQRRRDALGAAAALAPRRRRRRGQGEHARHRARRRADQRRPRHPVGPLSRRHELGAPRSAQGAAWAASPTNSATCRVPIRRRRRAGTEGGGRRRRRGGAGEGRSRPRGLRRRSLR